jgi:hypothetical protein
MADTSPTPEKLPARPADADGVDEFLDAQATGPDIYDPDYVMPLRPRWRQLPEWEKEEML